MNNTAMVETLAVEQPLSVDGDVLDHSQFIESESLDTGCGQPDLIGDFNIDYDEIIASTRPGQEGARIVFDTGDYATDEEADAALEAYLTRILGGPDED